LLVRHGLTIIISIGHNDFCVLAKKERILEEDSCFYIFEWFFIYNSIDNAVLVTFASKKFVCFLSLNFEFLLFEKLVFLFYEGSYSVSQKYLFFTCFSKATISVCFSMNGELNANMM